MRININFDNNLGFKELNPATCQDTSTANILHNIYKGLMIYEGNKLVKGTLESYTFDKLSNKYTFYLDDSYWSNSRPVCSKDFIEAWVKVIKENSFTVQDFKIIKNVERFLEGKCDEKEIGLQILNEKSFTVILEKSCPYFLHLTASTPYLPVPYSVEYPEKGLIGNREFIVKSKSENSILLENLERTREIYITCDGDEDSIHQRFMRQEIHLSDGIPNEYMELYTKKNLLKYVPEFGTAFLQFNCERLNLEERTEIERVINVEKIMESSIQNKSTKHYIPWKNFFEFTLTTNKNNYSKRREVFKRKSIKILVNNIEQYKKMALICAEQLKTELNIEVELIQEEWEEFTENLYNAEFDIAISGWIGDYFDPSSLLSIWKSDSPNNFSKFYDNTFDNILNLSEEIEIENERFNKLRLAEAILLDKRVIIPLYHYSLPLLLQEGLSHNFKYSPQGIIDFNTIKRRKEVL